MDHHRRRSNDRNFCLANVYLSGRYDIEFIVLNGLIVRIRCDKCRRYKQNKILNRAVHCLFVVRMFAMRCGFQMMLVVLMCWIVHGNLMNCCRNDSYKIFLLYKLRLKSRSNGMVIGLLTVEHMSMMNAVLL